MKLRIQELTYNKFQHYSQASEFCPSHGRRQKRTKQNTWGACEITGKHQH